MFKKFAFSALAAFFIVLSSSTPSYAQSKSNALSAKLASSSKAMGIRNCFEPLWDPYLGCSVDCQGFICILENWWEKACSSRLEGTPLEFLPGAHPPEYQALVGGYPATCVRETAGSN